MKQSEDLPVYISSDEEEGGEVEVGIRYEGEGVPPPSSDDKICQIVLMTSQLK